MAPKRKTSVSETSPSGTRRDGSRSPIKGELARADAHPSQALVPETTLPPYARFPLVVVTTMAVAGIANTIGAEFTQDSLAAISRDTWNESWRVVTVIAWKVFELAIAWSSGFDDIDMLSFSVLAYLPHAYLLHTLYLVPVQPVLLHFLITCAANTTPFFIFRRRSSSHVIVTRDITLWITTALLASTLYAIPLYSSLLTWLPGSLATSFETLKSVESAYAVQVSSLATVLLPIGVFAHALLFAPTLHPPASTLYLSEEAAHFDPETATLGETVYRNLLWWRFLPPREQEIVRRTITLVFWTAANCWFWSWISVQGSQGWGALAWASVWASGAALSGTVLGWVAAAA